MKVELADITLPPFGLPTVEPLIPVATYERRIAQVQALCAEHGYDFIVVYGDREHFANLAYLTRYDPRFEEALLIVAPDDLPTLLVGNEGMSYSAISPVEMRRILYQPFSLLSMPRSSSPPLKAILQQAGIKAGMRVGMVGWKYFTEIETETPGRWIEAPAFIVDTLRELCCELENTTRLFMHPEYGLRATNDVDQLAVFEFAATHSSQGMRNLIFNIRPGITEYEAVQLMAITGLPMAFHPIVLSGERSGLAPASPSSRKLKAGDPIIAALGYWGSNTARAGFLVAGASDLPTDIRDYVVKLVAPYFSAAVEWYECAGIGITGGELYEIIHARIGDPFFGVFLNPGHLIHMDEWVSSPIYEGSTEKLTSGMALQVDIIPATGTRYFTTNIEDGIALADGALRAEFAQKYPDAWERIQKRRAFMQDMLGIRIKPEVLPFSNIPAYLPPFWLSPHMAMKVV